MQIAMMRRVVMARLMRHSAPPIKPRAARGRKAAFTKVSNKLTADPFSSQNQCVDLDVQVWDREVILPPGRNHP
jgi:hypothetical protein